jgi:outer membrane lipoprotein-sorting protein
MKTKVYFIGLLILGFTCNMFAQDVSAYEVIKKANEKYQGESNYGEFTMEIIRPNWSRTLSFKSCAIGSDYSITLVTDPAKEKGQTFMKRLNDLWSWNPKISRLIKLPPSMLAQGWMGSDYSNDDILKESSIVVDYNHSFTGSEAIAEKDCHIIELTPKEDAAVVWGKVIKWVSKDGYLQLKTEYYDEDNYLIKTDLCSDVKFMGDREIPTRMEIIPEEEPDNRTIVTITNIVYNITITDGFFSQQTMKKGMAINFPQN